VNQHQDSSRRGRGRPNDPASDVTANEPPSLNTKISPSFVPQPAIDVEPGVWLSGPDAVNMRCAACGKPYGNFKRDPWTRKAVHEECIMQRPPQQIVDHQVAPAPMWGPKDFPPSPAVPTPPAEAVRLHEQPDQP
jgi:hypothetical protein